MKQKTTSQMYQLIKELYPIPRSITGNGVRKTLAVLAKHIPLTVHEVPSGTKVFDWEVPDEWNITDAYIKGSSGKKVVDFSESSLHVVNYSIPVATKLPLTKLKEHIFTLPDNEDAIPYRTSYYEKTWGFCMKHTDFKKLKDEVYKVKIDALRNKGSLTYAEFVIPGKSNKEVLISTHICHPALANDNLSGIAVAVFLAKALSQHKNFYTYRFVFVPGTIGSLTWLWKNKKNLRHIMHGLVLTGVGDRGGLTYKKSRRGDTQIDRVMQCVLGKKDKSTILDFYPFGYDERQYCSPGFNLPVGTLMRSKHGTYKEYHTSLDNLSFISEASLAETLKVVYEALSILESNMVYKNLFPYGEPNLGKRGLYKAMNQQDTKRKEKQLAMLWILNMSDGSHDLLTIAQKSNIDFSLIVDAAYLLKKQNIIQEVYEK